jgi:hypothetical protein
MAMDGAKTNLLKFKLYYQKDLNSLTKPLGYGGGNIKDGWKLSEKSNAKLSETGKRLLFCTQRRIEYTIDTRLMEDEIAQVKVCNYKDRMTQPEQNIRLSTLEGQSAPVIWDTEKETVQLLNGYELQDTDWDDAVL